MIRSKFKATAIPLKKWNKNISTAERKFIEAEKKYYNLVVTLKKKREKLGLTQEKLAKIAKVPRTTITKIESGSRNTTLQTLIAIAQAMGKNLELRLV